MKIHTKSNPMIKNVTPIAAAITCVLSFSASALNMSTLAKIDASSLVWQQSNDMNVMLALPAGQSVSAVNTVHVSETGRSISKFQQKVHGVPVFGSTFTARQSGMGFYSNIKGSLVSGLERQKKLRKSAVISSDEAVLIALSVDREGAEKTDVRNIISQEWIYPLGSEYRRVYRVSYFKELSKPARIESLIDVHSGKILNRADVLTHQYAADSTPVPFGKAKGPGGNKKTGLYHYGIDFDFMDVEQTDATCVMHSANVDTYDLNHTTSTPANPYTFACPENTVKSINGAYSPLNDAHYFGNQIFAMYHDYVREAPLLIKLNMRVHYSNNYENAFWDGSAMTFGDGGDTFYPLVTLDVAAHEVSHGFTERHTGFVFSGMPGALNESFSDMAGEAAEYFMYGSTDWKVGAQVFKGEGALRYLDEPTKDGRSIAHASDFTRSMDVHFSSGVFNKAYYLLSTTAGWTPRSAFKVMALANQTYWTATSTFDEAACGVYDATADLGYNQADVAAAFNAVGVNVCDVIIDPGNVLYNGVPEIITGDKDTELHYLHYTPEDIITAKFIMSGGIGDADIYVKFGSIPTTTDYDCRPYTSGNVESCVFSPAQVGKYHVMVRGYRPYAGVSLMAEDINSVASNSGTVTDINVGVDEWQFWTVEVPHGAKLFRANITGGLGDADLYLKQGSEPTFSTYDCRPFDNGNEETCTMNNPDSGTWYIGLRGYVETSGMTLKWFYE